ncbi:MAG: RHS repeat protein, partial [Planctomycetes bacterium]|nr:RHS repeat protein [Planctomycetota bacterium]
MASLLAFAAVHAAAPLLLPTTLSLLPSAAIAQQNPSPLFVQGPALPVPNASPQGIVPDRNAEWLEVDSNLAVAVHTGELWHRSTDVNIPARGMALEVRRVYRSQIAYGGPFGWNGSHNWDQRVMFDGSNLTHLDGERLVVDTYTPIAGGLWACQTPGLYRKARFDGARWQIRDRDGSIREFLALDGSPGEGRIESYTDPFGNAITCSYTAAGRLATLHDTVGRALTFAYNVHGVISSITDFGGRQTVYGYTGSDLTSVRTPVVVGTPVGPNGNNNDFPNGRETLFDYNNSHNLRKVKYPREVAANGAWNVTFTHNGDAVRTATTAGATLQLDFVSSSYPGAIGRTTLTDLRGFVTHYDCSAAGQVLAMEQVTAGLHANDPASFLTTNVHNAHGERTLVTRPSGEALYYFFDDQNVDLFQHGTVIDHVIVPASGAPGQQNPFGKTPIVDPVYQQLLTSSETGDKKYLDYQEATPAQNGLQTLLDDWDINTGSLDLSGLGDLNGDGIVNQIGGNVVRHDSRQITIGVATPVTIIRCSTYDAFGRLLTTTSGEGSLRVLEYGPDTAGGLLASYIDDANPEAHAPNAGTAFWNKPPTVEYVEAETTLARDQFGYVIAKTDARGVRRDYVRNVLGEILVSIEGAGVDASRLDPRLAALQTAGYGHLVAPGYEVWHRYDANGNRVRSDVENVGSGMGDAWITTTRTFDAWGRLERVTREVEPGKLLSWSLAHDANGRQTRVTRPKGDFDTWSYDERGLALDYVAGAADPATASQISYTYDLNSNLIEVTGPDDLDGNGKIDKYLQVFDGRDRLLSQIDPVGTEVRQTYDNYDTSLGYQVLGTSSGPSPTDNDTTGNVSLGEATQLLDEMDRVVQERRRLFLPAGQGGSLPFTVGNVWLETSFEYDRDNLPIVVTDPEGRI